MTEQQPTRTYVPGTLVQYKNGVVYIKPTKGKMISLARFNAQITDKVIGGGQDLEPGMRVMHLDMNSHGEEGHDNPKNLVVVRWRTHKFQFLKKSRVIFIPHKLATAKMKEVVLS
jgi:hypothetical protein